MLFVCLRALTAGRVLVCTVPWFGGGDAGAAALAGPCRDALETVVSSMQVHGFGSNVAHKCCARA